MARLRHTLEEARNSAELLADKLVASTSWGNTVQKLDASPATIDRQGKSSKHPTCWIVTYKMRTPSGLSMDGSEVFVKVNLESKFANFCD